MTDKLPLPELLSPAGSEESLRAALAGGADAVYFGHSAFSNRMRAKNFTDDTIRDAIKLCHDCGAAAHITVNTRVRDRENDEILRLLEILLGGEADSRADAIIVADLGIARLIKERYPHATLHASTQTSLMSPSDCATLAELGFSRLVIPREMSFSEISSLVKQASPVEIEMFIHGAHCVSLSGQCLMSFAQGGRSGNRGECAQPCRLPFTCGGSCSDRLSLADMCLGGRITDVIASGVASLKIEGRLKSPSYVYGVTSVYRRLLDERRNATPRDIRELEALFTRGFTDGYFAHRYGRMSSSRVSGTAEGGSSTISQTVSAALKQRIANHREKSKTEGKLPISAEFTISHGAPSSLTLTLGEKSVTVLGEVPSVAEGRPLTSEGAAKNLTKMGSTPYSLSENNIIFNIEDNLWMPASAINSLRRDATDALLALSAADVDTFVGMTPKESTLPLPSKTEWVAEFADLSEMDSSAAQIPSLLDRIIVPAAQVDLAAKLFGGTGKICPSLPVFTPDDEAVIELIGKLKSIGATRILCHTIGQVRLVREAGLHADMSFRANITSECALSVYRDLGCASVTLSPELPGGAMKNLGKSVGGISIGCIAYGKFPVMTTARCLISDGRCKKGNFGGRISTGENVKEHSCRTYFTDRMGQDFPVIGQADCTNVIYNSTPIWMGDRLSEIERHDKRGHLIFMFTDEAADEVIDVLNRYARGEKSAGRRV
ncbi:MAG: U32 family peptidase [Clostridia bacterium]|nr:U32 family peptidase [Clostridia bacterium]